MNIATVKKKYKNPWVLAEVIKENDLNQPVDVKPIAVNKDRNKIYEAIAKVPKDKTVATLYTGKISGIYVFVNETIKI